MPKKDVVSMSNKSSDESIKHTLESIDQLLAMAEKSEKNIAENQRDKIMILSLSLCLILISMLSFNTKDIQNLLKSPNVSLCWITLIVIAFFFIMYRLYRQHVKIDKNKKNEEIVFRSSLEVVQEILPYYFDKMSILERKVYNIRLSKLGIVKTEANPEKINPSTQN